MPKPFTVTDANFQQEVLEASVPVLVDFWADWCQPCKLIAPLVDELSEEYDGKIKFTKMDVDANTHTPSQYGIRGIPTLLIFREGQAVQQMVGAVAKSMLKKRLDAVLTSD